MRARQKAIVKRLHWGLTILIICLQGLKLSAQDNYYHLPNNIGPDSEISLLTASPSAEAIYTVYGHAGLRVQALNQGIDLTFNYGIFDFTDDFFVHFVSGQTDYLVIPVHSYLYINEYVSRGSQITEIKLQLDEETKNYLWHYLVNNIEPENRIYRYNFFYDNCSIRLIKVIKEAIEQSHLGAKKLVLDTSKLNKELASSTWRKEINQLEAPMPWLVLGTDLALGSQTDSQISFEERCFLPHYLALILPKYDQVYTDENGVEQKQPLVKSIETIGELRPTEEKSKLISILSSPSLLFFLLLLLFTYKSWQIYKGRRNVSKIWDISLFLATGFIGLILCYISFISEHPHVFPNHNIWVFNPLNLLIAVPFLAINRLNNWAYRYHFANFVIQLGFLLLAYFLPQHFNVVVYYLSLTLAILSLARMIEHKRSKNKISLSSKGC